MPVGNLMASKFISILALPRSGTNYLCGLMRRFQEIDSLYEIYHHQAVYVGNKNLSDRIINYINYHHRLNIINNSDQILIDFVHQNPQEILKIISLQSSSEYISFKIFPNHLSPESFSSAIMQNSQIKKILVKRNLLNIYFSLKFAEITAVWRDQNTSNLKLDFDEDDFINWYADHQKYYQFIENECKKNNCQATVLEYEEIHSLQSDREKFIFLFNFLKSIGLELEESNLYIPDKKLSNLRKKQDVRTNILEKVNKPQSLIDTLKSHKLEFLLA